jgi:hypothetical protein
LPHPEAQITIKRKIAPKTAMLRLRLNFVPQRSLADAEPIINARVPAGCISPFGIQRLGTKYAKTPHRLRC